jgi:uncharacterized membrane protein YeiH
LVGAIGIFRAAREADAFTLAHFTIVGTHKGVAMNFAPLVARMLGVVTGVAGGILRDMLAGEAPMVSRPQIYLYATAALAGGRQRSRSGTGSRRINPSPQSSARC